MKAFFGIAYFITSTVAFFATISGVQYALDFNTFFSAIIAGFLSYIPLLGSLTGMYGAMNVWDFSLLQAGVLFFWYVPVFVLLYVLELRENRRRGY